MLATRLKQLRKEVGMTQVELAEKLGVSKGVVAMWETGRRKPGYENLGRLAAMFNEKVDYLLGFSEEASTMGEGDKIDGFPSQKTQLPQTLPNLMQCHPVTGGRTTQNDLAKVIFLLSDLLLNNESVQNALQSIANEIDQVCKREVQ